MHRFALLFLLATGAASAQTYTGRLAPGDETLPSGEFVDEYAVQARSGQTVRAVVTSDDFDTYVIVGTGSDAQEDNDDCTEGDTTRSCADFLAESGGRVRILVTSFEVGETGAYRLEITTGGAASPRPPSGPGGADSGELAPGDETLESGEFVDRRSVRLSRGDDLSVVLTSSDFDPYIIVKAPDESQEENDDCTEGETTRSCLDLTADQSGTYEVLITSFAPGERGRYQVSIDTGGGATGGPRPPSAPATGGVRTERGVLQRGDATLSSGEFRDTYTVRGEGGSLVLDLRSESFDPYLLVLTPDGDQFENDDHEGALDRSLLVLQTRPGEEYDVIVTSFASGETGAYTLDIRSDDAAVASGARTETGRLAPGDEALSSGEYVDLYTFEGVPGQRLRADLTSDDFDTYLAIRSPKGDLVFDDDGGGRVGHSLLEMDLTEPGTYTVVVTSFAGGETGDYRLDLDLTERFGQVTQSQASARDTPSTSTGRGTTQAVSRAYTTSAVSRLNLERTLSGALDASDQRLSSGEFMEVHTFDGEAGQALFVDMTSTAFDTYLIVEGPSGQQISNDDYEQSTGRSAVEFRMPETGRYRVIATSYTSGETGPYQIRLSQADALTADPPPYDRIMGLFVGISEYDRMGSLRWTAEDAEVAYDAMIRAGMDPADGILLTDREATLAAVQSAARRLAARADDRTMFVFFFSGHGGQYARSSFQRSDPDGLDESLELFDTEILDDDLDVLLASIQSARQLIVLDACYSGGFAKDIVSRPGRMGLFSSEEDVVSAVAVKFEAGGYLSRFFADGVAERQADEDGNGAVTALELSHYLDGRFVADVRSEADPLALIAARETRPEHQRLIIDRGSVGLYESLFLFGR